MRVGILGSGLMGSKLGTLFAGAGGRPGCGRHVWSRPFSTAPSEVLFSVFEKRNHKGAKKTAAKLIRDVGFNPVDLGELSAARYVEPFSLLVAEIAYNRSAGPELAYRFESIS